jgi:hypothetical protein
MSGMRWHPLILAHYAAVVSTIAIILSGGSLIYTKLNYDLSAAKEERELQDKEPAIDIQIRPLGASVASLVISIINRADFNIAPQSIEVENSLEAGTLYAINLAVFPARLKGTRQVTNRPPTHSVGAHPGPRLALSRGDLDL